MYPKYFGLNESSFSIAPDPHYLFLSEQHKEALAHLLYAAGESGGFLLLTGEVGTGKTTVCRAFLEQLPEGVDVALIVNPAMTANELLLNICEEFCIPVAPGERSIKVLVDLLNGYLLDAHAKGRRPVLMIDEAQNLRPKVMEQIRLLTNLETSKSKLLKIFLVGQPELRRVLEREGLRQLNQRITARFHLRPLTAAETGDYIRHRVAVAGVDRPLFTAAAIRRIHAVSDGVPRVINILCDRALLGACVTRASQVTPRIVAKAAREVRGEVIEAVPQPGVRPAYAAAAVVALLLATGWLSYDRLYGDPAERIAALFDGEEPAESDVRVSSTPSSVARPGFEGREAAPVPAPAEVAKAAEPSPAATTPSSAAPAVAQGPSVGVALSPAASPGPAATASPIPPTVPDQTVPDQAPAPVHSPISATMAAAAKTGVEAQSLPLVSLASLQPESAADTLARLALPEDAALRVLLRRWDVDVQDLGAGDPCRRLAGLGLRCAREEGRLSNVRYFDRPALLRVADGAGPPRYLVLGALDESFGTVDLAAGSERVPVAGLETIWTGDYTIVWQPPPTGAAVIGPGSSQDSVRWLRRLLSEVPGLSFIDNESSLYDRTLSAGVRRIQTARGLQPDGIAGPRTLIQLQNAVGMTGNPRLMPAAAAVASPVPDATQVGLQTTAEPEKAPVAP